MEGIGDRFQRETKYHRDRMEPHFLDWERKPDTYKAYPENDKIELPPPDLSRSLPFEQILQKRRSIRGFSQEPLDLVEISTLLWSCTGIREEIRGYAFRTAPSAGALYPIETYLAINPAMNRGEEMPGGIYHYNIRDHALEELKRGDYGLQAARAALDQRMCLEAPVVFLWTAVFERSLWKYRQRGYRYIYLDAGHIAENLALAATALGLGSCQIAALYDEEANALIGVDGVGESVIYMSAAGRIRPR